MSSKLQLICISLLVIICASFVAPSFGSEPLTIELKNGESYTGLHGFADFGSKTFSINPVDNPDTTMSFAFADIQGITDTNGENITHKLLGNFYRPGSNIDFNNNAGRNNKNGKPWYFGARFSSNYSYPIGTWFEDVNHGVGYEGTLLLSLSRSLSLRFDFSRSGLNVDDDFIRLYSYDPNYDIQDQKSSLAASRYFVSIQYNEIKKGISPKNGVIYYFWSGLGAVVQKFEYSATLIEYSTGNRYWDKVDDTYTDFAFHGGGGIGIPIVNKIALDLSCSLDYIFVGTYEDYNGTTQLQTAFIADIKLGIIFFI